MSTDIATCTAAEGTDKVYGSVISCSKLSSESSPQNGIILPSLCVILSISLERGRAI